MSKTKKRVGKKPTLSAKRKTIKIDGDKLGNEIDRLCNEDDFDWSSFGDGKVETGIFKGFKIKFKALGEHYNDGQLVDYKITFTSPNKEKTIVEGRMCLMIGWENAFDGDYKIKV